MFCSSALQLAATLRVPATAGFDAGLPLAPALTAPCTLEADRKAAKGKCCQVDGCATPLPTPQSAVRGGADAYCFRYRVCAAHLRAPSVRLRGARSAASLRNCPHKILTRLSQGLRHPARPRGGARSARASSHKQPLRAPVAPAPPSSVAVWRPAKQQRAGQGRPHHRPPPHRRRLLTRAWWHSSTTGAAHKRTQG